jgi:hypothetical protein
MFLGSDIRTGYAEDEEKKGVECAGAEGGDGGSVAKRSLPFENFNGQATPALSRV